MVWARRWAWLGVALLAACATEPAQKVTAVQMARILLAGEGAAFYRQVLKHDPAEFDALARGLADLRNNAGSTDDGFQFGYKWGQALYAKYLPQIAQAPLPELRQAFEGMRSAVSAMSANPVVCNAFLNGTFSQLSDAETAPFVKSIQRLSEVGLFAGFAGKASPTVRPAATGADWLAVVPGLGDDPAFRAFDAGSDPSDPAFCTVAVRILDTVADSQRPEAEQVMASLLSGQSQR